MQTEYILSKIKQNLLDKLCESFCKEHGENNVLSNGLVNKDSLFISVICKKCFTRKLGVFELTSVHHQRK